MRSDGAKDVYRSGRDSLISLSLVTRQIGTEMGEKAISAVTLPSPVAQETTVGKSQLGVGRSSGVQPDAMKQGRGM